MQVPPSTIYSLDYTLPSGTAEDYTLSRPTERIDYFVSHTWHAGRPAKFLVRIAPTNPRLTLNLTLSLSLTLTMALTLARALTLTLTTGAVALLQASHYADMYTPAAAAPQPSYRTYLRRRAACPSRAPY